MARGLQRQRIGGEGARCAAEHVAGKLVEQHDEREALRRVLLPGGKRAAGTLLVKLQEARAHLLVERAVLLEPALVAAALTEPERQDRLRTGIGGLHTLQ